MKIIIYYGYVFGLGTRENLLGQKNLPFFRYTRYELNSLYVNQAKTLFYFYFKAKIIYKMFFREAEKMTMYELYGKNVFFSFW